jgi:hypothetical protein
VAEMVPQSGTLVECSVVRRDLCRDALQVVHGTIVPRTAGRWAVLTSTTDINGAGPAWPGRSPVVPRSDRTPKAGVGDLRHSERC